MEYPTAKYTDGTDGKIKKYTAYVNGQECEVREGKVTLPKDVSSGKCALRLEWKKDGSTEYCEKTIKAEAPDDEPSKAPDVNPAGNTISRISSLGYFIQQGNWFFYCTDRAIYKTKDMEKKGEKICGAVGPSNINVVGDWIYYVGRGNEGDGYDSIEDGWIYYTEYTESIEEGSLLVSRFNIETGKTESVQVIDLIDYEMGEVIYRDT